MTSLRCAEPFQIRRHDSRVLLVGLEETMGGGGGVGGGGGGVGKDRGVAWLWLGSVQSPWK